MAILDHYKEGTLHDHCSSGKEGWCSFQRDIATGNKPIKSPLPGTVVKVIKPLFNRLERKKFQLKNVEHKMLTSYFTTLCGNMHLKIKLIQ